MGQSAPSPSQNNSAQKKKKQQSTPNKAAKDDPKVVDIVDLEDSCDKRPDEKADALPEAAPVASPAEDPDSDATNVEGEEDTRMDLQDENTVEVEYPQREPMITIDDDEDSDEVQKPRTKLRESPWRTGQSTERGVELKRKSTPKRRSAPSKGKLADGIIGMKVRSPTNGRDST